MREPRFCAVTLASDKGLGSAPRCARALCTLSCVLALLESAWD